MVADSPDDWQQSMSEGAKITFDILTNFNVRFSFFPFP